MKPVGEARYFRDASQIVLALVIAVVMAFPHFRAGHSKNAGEICTPFWGVVRRVRSIFRDRLVRVASSLLLDIRLVSLSGVNYTRRHDVIE